MKIGKHNVTLATPSDLDEKLLASTGCSADEMREGLRSTPLASYVAQALLPFVKEPISMHELATLIGEAGIDTIRNKVISLYDARK